MRRKDRQELAESVLIKNKSSFKAFRVEQIGLGFTHVPSEEVIRKCLSDP